MAAVLLRKTLCIFYLFLFCTKKSVSWNVEIVEDTDTAWNASDLIYGPEANHDHDYGEASSVDKTQDQKALETNVTSLESSTKTSRTGKKSDEDDLIHFEFDHVNKFFQGILKDEGINNGDLETREKDGIFVLIDGEYDFGIEDGSDSVNDSNEAVVVQEQQNLASTTLPITSTLETNIEITSWTPEDSFQSTEATESAYDDRNYILTTSPHSETPLDDEILTMSTIISPVVAQTRPLPTMVSDTFEFPSEVPTPTSSTTSVPTTASAIPQPVPLSTTTSRLLRTEATSSVSTTSVSPIATTSVPASETMMTTFGTETTSVQTSNSVSAEAPTVPLEPANFQPELTTPPALTASASTVSTSAATSTTAVPQIVVIHNHHYHFHFPDEDHEAVIQVADTPTTAVPTRPKPTRNPANIPSTTRKASLPVLNLSPENQKVWNQTIEALLNQQQKTRRSRMLRSRTSSYGPGIRRRQTVHSCQLRNLSKAKGTGQVVVYKIVRQNGNKVKLVKNMRKKPLQVFPIKRVVGPKAFKRQTKWKVVPQWKIHALEQAGFNITYGKVERRRMKAKPAGRPTTPEPPVDATTFAILMPTSRNSKNFDRSLPGDSEKLRFMTQYQNIATSEYPLYKLGNLDLKLKNRLKQ